MESAPRRSSLDYCSLVPEPIPFDTASSEESRLSLSATQHGGIKAFPIKDRINPKRSAVSKECRRSSEFVNPFDTWLAERVRRTLHGFARDKVLYCLSRCVA